MICLIDRNHIATFVLLPRDGGISRLRAARTPIGVVIPSSIGIWGRIAGEGAVVELKVDGGGIGGPGLEGDTT